MVRLNTSRSSWVTEHDEVDPAFKEWGAKQPRRISTELIKPTTVAVPHLPWVIGDDDVLSKMRGRGIRWRYLPGTDYVSARRPVLLEKEEGMKYGIFKVGNSYFVPLKSGIVVRRNSWQRAYSLARKDANN